MANIRVLLADDHAMLREGITVLIDAQQDMQVIAHAADGASALEQIEVWQPDVVVIDLSMPGMSGLAAIETARRTQPHTHLLVLTRHTEPAYVRRVLHANVGGYVLKQSGAAALLQAIRSIATGAIYLDPALAPQLAERFATGTQADDTARAPLSERENNVVRLLAHGHSNKEIATQLGVSVKTIDTYKVRAMDKLGIYGRAALVRYALQQGWFDTL